MFLAGLCLIVSHALFSGVLQSHIYLDSNTLILVGDLDLLGVSNYPP